LTPRAASVFIAAMTRQALFLALALAAGGLAAAPAGAADLPSQTQSPLPSLAADPATQAPNWSGFYVGAGVSAASFKGAKGQFGGDVFAGYDHKFDNNVVLGVRFSTGYSPWAYSAGRYKGFDFGEADVKLGYAMGRLTPYVVLGAAVARPTYGADFGDLSQSVNGLFSGPGAAQTLGTAGVGFDYAVTNNFSVGVEARVTNGAPSPLLGPVH
jgi:opacity protein-like surface antigen